MNKLFFLLGFLSTLQIFKYKLLGAFVYPFDLVYYSTILIIAFQIIKNKDKISFPLEGITKTILTLFFINYLFSINFISPIIDNANSYNILPAIKFFLKKIIFLVFFFLILISEKNIKSKFINLYISGFYISIIFHAIYSYIVLYFWYFHHFDIHTKWLSFFGITEHSVGHGFKNFIYYPILRTNGFHWDPAYFGLWGILGFFFILLKTDGVYKKISFIAIIFIPWVFTFSRSAVFGLLCTSVILIIIMFKTKKNLPHLLNSINAKSVILLSFIIPLMLFISVSGKISFIEILKSRVQVEEDVHTQKHLQYPMMATKALLNNPLHFFFGYGNRNSGRAIADDIIAIQDDFHADRAFDVESDLVRIPLNRGLLGFSVYLIFIAVILFELIKAYFRSKDRLYLFVFIVICSTFFAGFFYAYNDSIWVWMFWATAIFLLQKDEKRKE